MQYPNVLPNDDGIRPAGKPDECFYCQQKVGAPHGPECVAVTKRVKVRYTFEIEIDAPANWNKENVEFYRNDGTWCASNALDDIKEFIGMDDQDSIACLCPHFRCDYLGDADPTPRVKEREVVGEVS